MSDMAPKPKKSKIRKFLCGILFTFVILITITVLLTVFENWSGARRWKEVHEMLVREGVELDPKKLSPETPAPSENFAATPLISALSDFHKDHDANDSITYADQDSVDRFRKLRLPEELDHHNILPDYATSGQANLNGVAEQIQKSGFQLSPDDSTPAQIIRSWMTQFETELAALDEAANRPEAVLDFEIAEDFLGQISMSVPFTNDFLKHQRFQAIRVCAALENGDETEALAALRTMFQISRTAGSSPILINLLVGISCHNTALSVIWQGIKTESWSSESLNEIDHLITGKSENMLSNLEKAINLEMVMMQIGGSDYLKNEASKNDGFATGEDVNNLFPGGLLTFRFIPDGIFDHNKAFGCELMFKHFLKPIRDRNFFSPDQGLEESFEKRSPRNFLASITIPAIEGVLMQCFQCGTMTELARAAIAVEQTKLQTGKFPGSYPEIAYRFSSAPPGEIISGLGGGDLHYKQVGKSYLVYSPGYNQVDDGGTIVLKPNSKNSDPRKGDWVWKYN